MRYRLIAAMLCGFLLQAGPSYAQSPNPQRLFEIGMNAFTGVGDSHKPQTALDYIHRSADVGYPPAEVMLGYFYETGTLVTKEPGQAQSWYKKAAQQDDPVGEWLLGRLIFSGAVPPRDLNEAGRWLQRAAAHNDPFGEYLLGRVKLERQDYAQAAEWFRKASMQGLPQAQQQLGILLKSGQGVNADKVEAYVWLEMSYEGGNQSAAVANNLAELQGALSSAQIDQAKSRAHELQPATNRVVVARGCTGWQGEFDLIPAPPPPDIQDFCR